MKKKCNCEKCKKNPGDPSELYRFKTERMQRAIYVCFDRWKELKSITDFQTRLKSALTEIPVIIEK